MIQSITSKINFLNLACLLVLFCLEINAQERIYDLEYNPTLYYRNHNPDADMQMALVKKDYLIVPDTLDIPFFEDFSKDRLFQKKPWSNLLLDTVNRSIQLGSTIDTFAYSISPSWNYTLNGSTLDSTQKAPIQLILNDDFFDPKIKTDTINAWPSYYRYFLNAGNLDSVQVPADSVVLYTKFELIQDTSSKWLDRQVFINNTFVENKLSYNVATFDGLNENGLPYDPKRQYGPADTLTSQAIDLSTFTINDNLYLSFYYLSTGLGNKPEEEDSLILEFNKNGAWSMVWSSPGFESNNDVIEDWQIALLPIDDNFYFSKTFQFRFRNKASLTGNNDHWHIDYVYLAANRNAQDTVVRDVSVLAAPSTFLKRYRSMPWNQFEGFESLETADNITLSYKNNYAVQQSISFAYMVNELRSGTNIYNFPKQGTALPPFSPFSIDFPTSDFMPININQDSLEIELVNYIDEIPGALSIDNDTARTKVLFYNYLAYDDGSAERGYGLEGPGLKNFAYEFNLNVADTLRAVQFHFTQVNFDASDLLFTLNVWKSLADGGGDDELLYSKEFQKPVYSSLQNGFVTYYLDTPIYIDGKFYVGWDQTDEDNIQVGLDMNNSAQEYMYYKVGESWNKSLIEAAPMIRPVIGKELPLAVSNIPAKVETAYKIYPNPSNGIFKLESSKWSNYNYRVFDLQGKELMQGNFTGNAAEFSLADMQPGFYLLQIMDISEHKAQAFRLVKM